MKDDHKVYMTSDTKRCSSRTPYNKKFVKAARGLGGKWSNTQKTWVFPIAVEKRVRAAMIEIYGTDGDTTAATVTVHYETSQAYGRDLTMFGRTLALRRERDWGVHMGDGCSIVRGSFPSSGGSRKNPCLNLDDEIIIEIRDVPRKMALKACDKYEGVSIVYDENQEVTISITITEALEQQVLTVAAQKNLDLNNYLTEALERFLRENA